MQLVASRLEVTAHLNDTVWHRKTALKRPGLRFMTTLITECATTLMRSFPNSFRQWKMVYNSEIAWKINKRSFRCYSCGTDGTFHLSNQFLRWLLFFRPEKTEQRNEIRKDQLEQPPSMQHVLESVSKWSSMVSKWSFLFVFSVKNNSPKQNDVISLKRYKLHKNFQLR